MYPYTCCKVSMYTVLYHWYGLESTLYFLPKNRASKLVRSIVLLYTEPTNLASYCTIGPDYKISHRIHVVTTNY